MPRTLPDMKITVASMPCLSNIRVSLATWITVEVPGVVEIYAVLSLSAASGKIRLHASKAIMTRSQCTDGHDSEPYEYLQSFSWRRNSHPIHE